MCAGPGVAPDMAAIRVRWDDLVGETVEEATLTVPDIPVEAYATGGRRGIHGEGFSYLIGELQVVARDHPGATW